MSRPDRIQRPYLVESVKFPSPFQPAGRWWCKEWPHKGVGMSGECGVMSSSSSVEDIAYLGNVQVTM